MQPVDDKTLKSSIMIVEDSETQRVILRHILEQQGWTVTCTASAEQALDLLSTSAKKNPPDLIIIDYHLPGLQGDELCRRIKLNIDTRSIPTLMLTVESGDESQKHGLESGADDYLAKFTDDDILVLKIKSLLRKSKESHVLFGIGSSLFQSSRILAVDNSPTYLEFLAGAFKEDGIPIDTASSGQEALRKIKNKKYDCILVDLAMPGIDSIEIFKKIPGMSGSLEAPPTDGSYRHPSVFKEKKPKQDFLPMGEGFSGNFLENPRVVLLLTSHEKKEDMARALEAGADDFVAKSSDISIIKARVIALLRRKFILEDNKRIFEELKRKELEVERSRIEAAAAGTRALLAEKLLNTVEQLEEEIEERKRMEQQIKNYSHELERSNKELEAFAYVASHDLQEPLRAISSYLQLVERRYKTKLDDKGKDFIERAVNGAHRMQEMINDLLTYSRITTRGKPFEPYPLDSILDRALANLSAAVEQKKAVINRTPLPVLPCDDNQIIRLLQNLISNAVKFCDNHPPIIWVTAEEKEKEWLFSIKDNGIGIDPAHREDIFKIFFRLHGRSKYPGTGLGLAICQKIVERHGGKIKVESEPGKGSTFFFTLKKEGARTGKIPAHSKPPR